MNKAEIDAVNATPPVVNANEEFKKALGAARFVVEHDREDFAALPKFPSDLD